MADPSPPPSSTLVIPPETLAAFGPMIELIKGSESMNIEERQYWINILPIMTPEQLGNLKDILANEKTQLAAIDAKYATSGETGVPSAAIGESIRAKKIERQQKESEAAKSEEDKEADLMAQIQSL